MKDLVTIYYYPRNNSILRQMMEEAGIKVPHKYYAGLITILVVRNSTIEFVGNSGANYNEVIRRCEQDRLIKLETVCINSDDEFKAMLKGVNGHTNKENKI